MLIGWENFTLSSRFELDIFAKTDVEKAKY